MTCEVKYAFHFKASLGYLSGVNKNWSFVGITISDIILNYVQKCRNVGITMSNSI